MSDERRAAAAKAEELYAKEHLVACLEAWGATKDKKVENIYWLNNHCFLLTDTGRGWKIEEL
jgi:hypothetical protein